MEIGVEKTDRITVKIYGRRYEIKFWADGVIDVHGATERFHIERFIEGNGIRLCPDSISVQPPVAPQLEGDDEG